MIQILAVAWMMLFAAGQAALAQYPGWAHSGSLHILTTPEGANLPATASVEGFPLLVRLDKDWFDFSQAKANGEDLRFATSAGAALAYQIEAWDAAAGTAAVWIRIPTIQGNARQELKMYWGKPDAARESSGSAVFNDANGYLSVWHMSEPVQDEAGTLPSTNVGTTAAAGMVGQARHLAGRQGIFCGDKIANYPSGAAPHSTEAWFRPEQVNSTIIGWGNEGGNSGSKVRMMLYSPPHVHVDSDFRDVNGESKLPLSEWTHVVHTYDGADSRLYVNGKLDGSSKVGLLIKSPCRLWIGGWYNNYDYLGDLDEVRISKVARSADWVRLQYENQKPGQTLVGPLLQPGTDFAVMPKDLKVLEGKNATVTAHAGGAQKLYWIMKRGGQETLAAVDRFHFTLEAGRVTGDETLTLQFKAVYAGGVKTIDIPVTIKEDIQEPSFALKAPARWDGRETIEVLPKFSNLGEMQAKGAGELTHDWSVSGIAVIKEIAPGKLLLKRAQNSGPMTVTATVSNGGKPSTQAIRIEVQEPARDAWVHRTPAKDEKPANNQFYARDDRGDGRLYYNGTLPDAADSIFLKVYADNKLIATESRKPADDKSYAFAVKLKPGLIQYKVELVSKSGGNETVLNTVTNLVCGDAYVIDGQSNAEATAPGKTTNSTPWVRTFNAGWGEAVKAGTQMWIGYWGMDLAMHLVETYQIPICIINGAVGGTRIDQHLRNEANPTDEKTIYGRLLARVQAAGLTHGIRGVLWHQGEADQGTLGPTGDYDYKSYQQYFVDLSAAWKQDFPNIRNYYIYQIWPNACTDPSANDMLREVQRTLPYLYSNMRIMTTVGVVPGSSCHYEPAGYRRFAELMSPLVEQDNYGYKPGAVFSAPDVKKAWFTSAARNEIALEFDQDMTWSEGAQSLFFLDGTAGEVTAGSATGRLIKLQLGAASAAQKITYLQGFKWDGNQTKLLYGKNGVAALTFCEVPLGAEKRGR